MTTRATGESETYPVAMEEEEDAADSKEDRVCRICFEDEAESGEELISPCGCKGSHKWIHLSCLRRWQRMVLVSQPTHPAFWKEDERHETCSTCKCKFTCPPPSHHELMLSFTGPEIGALISPGKIIASHNKFSEMLQKQIQDEPILALLASYQHWIHGAYLITKVEKDDGTLELPLQTDSQKSRLLASVEDDMTVKASGLKRFKFTRISRQGSVDIEMDNLSAEEVKATVEREQTPFTLHLKSTTPMSSGDDTVTAVNLTRPTSEVPRSIVDEKNNAVQKLQEKLPQVKHVDVQFFLGGPCDDDKIVSCIVLGGPQGYSVVPTLHQGLAMAARRADITDARRGGFVGGQTVQLRDLQAKPELNGKLGLTCTFDSNTSRWAVRMQNGDVKTVRPANLSSVEGEHGRVLAFVGDARWTRGQLLGEIAKGHWGLCQSSTGDIIARPDQRRQGLEGRLVYAPETEMTEEGMRGMMDRLRNEASEAERAAGNEPNPAPAPSSTE